MILVTGGTGLVGAHLLSCLVMTKQSVRAIRRKNSDINAVKKVFSYYSSDAALFDAIEWVEADITDVPSLELAFEGVTHVYHAAALVSFSPKDYVEMRTVNIGGTANIVNLCVAYKVQKLCFVSSITTIEKKIGAGIIDESGEWDAEKNNYGYAISKYGAEMEVWRASQEGVPVVIVNPGVIIGGGFWNNGAGEMFKRVSDGFSFYSNGLTGFVGVKDVVKIMMALMDSSVVNQRFVLVSENVSFREVFSTIAVCLNKKIPTVKVFPFMSAIAWRLDRVLSFFLGRKPVLTKQTASSIHNVNYYSSQKIKQTMGVHFSSIKSVIKEVALQYKTRED